MSLGRGSGSRTHLAWLKLRPPRRLRHRSKRERLAGVEPACPAWRAGACAARPQTRIERKKQLPWQDSTLQPPASCRSMTCPPQRRWPRGPDSEALWHYLGTVTYSRRAVGGAGRSTVERQGKEEWVSSCGWDRTSVGLRQAKLTAS